VLLIPRYHVAGCAASTAITTLLAAIVAVSVLSRDGVLRWDSRHLTVPLRRAWEMLRIGLPATVQMALRNLSMIAVLKMITFLPGSVVGQGALQVGLQAEGLAFMPAFAFSIAAATLVGQNLGARRPEQARQSALYCVIGSQIVMWGIGSLLFFFPEYFVGLCIGGSAPEVIAPAANFLRILALCLPGLGAGMTFMGVLRGGGDTISTALISLTAMWVIRIPLAALLAFSSLGKFGLGYGFGLSGIWWAMTISVYIETALAYARFASGKWAKVKLAED
jgi:Na+-driven multidrug efflux pump